MKDECFIRGDIPMTKSEVRAVSLSKLGIERGSIIYDIGAGTGSVSVEAALLADKGHVYAFEKKPEGCDLIHANRDKFDIENLTVVSGKAPDSLKGIPAPDRVFVGGTGGNLEQILDTVFMRNPAVRVVINVIALESLCQVMEYFKRRKMEPEVIAMQISRAQIRGGYHMMQGQNPIYIITAEGKKPEQNRGEAPCQEGRDRTAQAKLPRIVIAAPASGSGKTMITIGLLALLKKRGISCASFKCGPDYIDPMFHRYVLGVPGCNLDSFFLDKEAVKNLFVEKSGTEDMAVIEGVMGYYDGIAGNTTQASTYEIAKVTDTPVILVLDGKKSSLSLVAQVKGFLEYKKDSRIAGVILNRTSALMAERLKPRLEELGIEFLGAVPQCEEAGLESRHLGLSIPEEQTALKERVERLAKRLEESLDVDGICKIASQASELEPCHREEAAFTGRKKRRMAIAKDEAFCFYYQENLDFLEAAGWELVPFSPMKDAGLPEGAEGILLGGGYPEIYAKELSKNQAMLDAIRHAADGNVKILAECGGFLYLHRSLEGTDGISYPMAGLIDGDGYRTDRLSRFGYITLQGSGGSIKGHEFHYWDSTMPGASMHAKKPGSSRGWDCMHVTEHMISGFPHLYYPSSPIWILNFLGEGAEG